MSNYIIKNQCTEISNIVCLTVNHHANYYSEKTVMETCNKFLHSASLLPDGKYLGWQLATTEDCGFICLAFSSQGTAVSTEDFRWIFEDCATVYAEPSTFPSESFFSEERKIYALIANPKAGNTDTPQSKYPHSARYDYKDSKARENFTSLLKMMCASGKCFLRIIAGAATNETSGQYTVLLSLPKAMSLRMKALLSLTLPFVSAIEVDREENGNVRQLPTDCIMYMMVGFQQAFIQHEETKMKAYEETENCETSYEEQIEKSTQLEEYKKNSDTACTPIEELELSIRSYNCLRRAGIDSVEKLQTMCEEELWGIRNLGKKCIEEIKRKLSATPKLSKEPASTAENYTAMLDELIGLAKVKEQIRRIRAYAKMKRNMELSGLPTTSIALNMEFTGNPGTAKTTVARILAGIFHEIGLLSSSELIEIGRADLVARYEGQTADKVKSIFRQAKGKLLFIDEAYSLVEQWEGSYGDEAINTIVQEMEKQREDTVVVFAGYPDKMEQFFSKNPGLRSRVPFQIKFQDYSVDEMKQISELEAKKRGFSIHESAKCKIADLCKAAKTATNAGNGRFCRNLVENAILSYAARIYRDNSDNPVNSNFTLMGEDFSATGLLDAQAATVPIGFRA